MLQRLGPCHLLFFWHSEFARRSLLYPRFDHFALFRRSAALLAALRGVNNPLAQGVQQVVELSTLRFTQAIDPGNMNVADDCEVVCHSIAAPRHDEAVPSAGDDEGEWSHLPQDLGAAHGNEFEAAKLAREHRQDALLAQRDLSFFPTAKAVFPIAKGRAAFPAATAEDRPPSVMQSGAFVGRRSCLNDGSDLDVEKLLELQAQSKPYPKDVVSQNCCFAARCGHRRSKSATKAQSARACAEGNWSFWRDRAGNVRITISGCAQ